MNLDDESGQLLPPDGILLTKAQAISDASVRRAAFRREVPKTGCASPAPFAHPEGAAPGRGDSEEGRLTNK
jgi:hypothetical protein